LFLILKKRIGTTAKIAENYGGFEITIIDNEKFPWVDVFSLLLDSGFQVWIDKKNSHIQVMSKPEVN
jgi:hypothetical protein